jgi:hypothetical protein
MTSWSHLMAIYYSLAIPAETASAVLLSGWIVR